jgi:hypothetical protein
MRGRIRTVLLVVVIIVVALSIGSCRYLGFLNPAWAVQGSWEITAKPDLDIWEPHSYFVFLPGADGYQIQDADRSVFESGPVLNLTESNFDYEIDEATVPEIVGQENYAEYTLNDDDLSITFYADRQKSANFGTIQAVRE